MGQLDLGLGVLFVQPEGQWIAGLLVGVERVDQILTPDVLAVSMIVEGAHPGDVVAGFLGQRVVNNDEAIRVPPVVTLVLQVLKPFVIQRGLVPVVLREKFVEGVFAL